MAAAALRVFRDVIEVFFDYQRVIIRIVLLCLKCGKKSSRYASGVAAKEFGFAIYGILTSRY